MDETQFHSIVLEINRRAKAYRIGELQEHRKTLRGLTRRPSSDLFDRRTTFAHYAFHWGGRKELQFNTGLEYDSTRLRYGVAFSLELNQTLPTLDPLLPKIARFNDYLQLYPERYADMKMWHHRDGKSSPPATIAAIPVDLVDEGVFIFLGKWQPVDQLDHDDILRELDRLLPLYFYCESGGEQSLATTQEAFHFRPGCTVKLSATKATQAQRKLDVRLRHNDIQALLYERLTKEYGADNVGTEIANGIGTSVDLVVRRPGKYWFYEIKTAHSSRACIRQAMGQLLEYSYWPNGQEASRLVVVGEPPLDAYGAAFLEELRSRFSLPIEYEQVSIDGS